MSTLLRELIEIPQQVGDEDYVLRLSEAVDEAHLAETLQQYVVTEDLNRAFDQALGLVSQAITRGQSRAAYLSGSFGAGKSHFMAVLHAVLGEVPAARAISALQPTIAQHDQVLAGRKILRLTFHMLGHETLEEALLGGYLAQIGRLHPGAPIPAVHHSDKILADGDRQRELLGDDARFLAELNGNQGGGSGVADPWAALLGAGSWTMDSYHAARAAAAGSEQRQQLVSALTRRFFTAYTAQAGYLGIDAGLSAVAAHAKGLGYDAVVLLIDELVLWLAFGVQDHEFFRREAQKLTNLVEHGGVTRAIPLVSFVARQMDLRRWFADSGASGAEQEMLDRAFRHQQDRFATIPLGDDNLAEVAHARLLHPRRDRPDARAQLDAAFNALDRRPAVWDVLLDGVNTDVSHRGSDARSFRLTYPFSPALVSTLRSLASVMQRERTALKVMQRMLVERRGSLTVDDVIPVGDAFEQLVTGSEPLDGQVASLFRSANALYRDKLRPLILRTNDVTEAQLRSAPESVPRSFHTDNRLAKTLLLSAVAPKVPALKEITSARLAALNHGSVVSPLPGSEATTVLGKVKGWQNTVPEIHVSDDSRNPLIRIRLADVDYESVVQSAKGEDNTGRRRELLRGMVREALGVADSPPDLAGALTHRVVWRGSAREVDLVFGNVRDPGWLPNDRFEARTGTWKFVIDHPFDESEHTRAEDVARIEQLLAGGMSSHTVVWVPHFLSDERMRNLSRLVVLDWLLTGTGERWRTHSDHLAETERIQARAILESEQQALRRTLLAAVQQAYGAAARTPDNLVDDDGHDRVLHSLNREFNPAAPVGADLGAAFGNLIDQAFRSVYPAHPMFEPANEPVRDRELALVAGYLERALAEEDGAVSVPANERGTLRRVANALRVGTVTETRFLFGDDRFPWGAELDKAVIRAGLSLADPIRVSQAREWLAASVPSRGLRDEVADLVIIAWAALRQRGWYTHTTPEPTPKPGALRPDLLLRPEPLPTVDQWDRALLRARTLFTGDDNPHLTPASLAAFVERVRAQAEALAVHARRLVSEVEAAYRRLSLPTDATGDRLAMARACVDLVEQLSRTTDRVAVVRAVGDASLPGTDDAAVKSLMTAAHVAEALRQFRWERLAPLFHAANSDPAGSGTDGKNAASSVLAELRDAVRGNQFDHPLPRELAHAEQAGFDWVARFGGTTSRSDTDRVSGTSTPGIDLTPPGPGDESGSGSRPAGGDDAVLLEQVAAFLRAHPDVTVRLNWRTMS